MARVKPRTPAGMRDFPPRELAVREAVLARIREVFERYGYAAIETPSLELFETLQGKLGQEGEQLLFKILRRGTALEELRLGKRHEVTVRDFAEVVDCALPYDLTVPFARFLAMHPDLPRPFKRYQIQRVWRADKPQRGRYREFVQCDIDVAGSASMLADAEIIAVIIEALRALGFRAFRTRIGHRKLLDGVVESVGGRAHFEPICVAIDKLDKIGPEGVREEMRARGVPAEPAAAILERIGIEGSPSEILAHLEAPLAATEHGPQGIAETRELFAILAALGVPEDHLALDLRLVRGLDYYTGPVYESVVSDPPIGSLTGGGRYDELIGRFTGQALPATGASIGLERILEVMQALDILPEPRAGTRVLVTIFDAERRDASLALAGELRRAGIATETPLKPTKGLKSQIAYASGKAIPLLAILGPDEIAAGEVTLRSGPRDQKRVARGQVVAEARAFLERLGRA